MNENAVLRNRLSTAYSKHPASRRIILTNEPFCETEHVDVQSAFLTMVEGAKDNAIASLRERVSELEGVIANNLAVTNEMITREEQALHNFQSTPIRQVYPAVQHSPVYPQPNIRKIAQYSILYFSIKSTIEIYNCNCLK